MKAVLPLLLALAAVPAQALTLDYTGFYDRMKKVQGDKYPLVSLRFYLNHRERGEPCRVLGGRLIDDNREWPLVVDKHQSLLLPFDKKLKDTRTVVSLELEDEIQCDFAMQLLSSDRVQQDFTYDDWAQLVEQFNGALKSFAGFPFSWLQPDVSGVVLTLESGTGINGEQWLTPTEREGEYRLMLAELPKDATVSFSQAPRWISPYFER